MKRLSGKESTCNAGDVGLIPELGRSPGERNGNPLQYSCLGKSHGQRSLWGYSPWGHKRVGHTWTTKQQQQWSAHSPYITCDTSLSYMNKLS